ncbi:molybdenum cofactor guanylyltransferase [Phycisphaerales bacterium]|nr:molybdenum cofactor guanylyltransferase [Phycisphaerales bacterium]
MNPAIQPVVLVGGRARRFGRDKLLEPWRGSMGGSLLVDQPILALRAALSTPVWLVGDCSRDAASRADRHVPDRYPGSGPLGGIVAALQESNRDIFVVPGDLPAFSSAAATHLLHAALAAPNAPAVLAQSERPEPCCGIYRQSALGSLLARLERHDLSLRPAAEEIGAIWVSLPPAELVNANTPEDLDALRPLK